MKNYYQILGVEKSASADEIKKAYRKMAHKYHPDKPGGDETRFKEVNEAYQILSDQNKRAQYDRFGQVFSGGAGPTPNWGNFGDFGRVDWDMAGGGIGDLGDIFSDLFEQFGFAKKKRQTYTHGSDVEVISELSLEEAFRGIKRKIRLKTLVNCVPCHGFGHNQEKGFNQCSLCQGKGEVQERKRTFFGEFSQIRTCPTCFGRGEMPKEICGKCNGRGRIPGEKEIEVEINPGVENGQIIQVKSAGEAGERGGKTGDLYIIVKVKPHSVFERRGKDLFITKDVRVTDALLGKKIKITDIGENLFDVMIPPGFNFKDKLRVEERGMPIFSPGMGKTKRGDLYITFNLEVPKKISKEAKRLLEDLDREL